MNTEEKRSEDRRNPEDLKYWSELESDKKETEWQTKKLSFVQKLLERLSQLLEKAQNINRLSDILHKSSKTVLKSLVVANSYLLIDFQICFVFEENQFHLEFKTICLNKSKKTKTLIFIVLELRIFWDSIFFLFPMSVAVWLATNYEKISIQGTATILLSKHISCIAIGTLCLM